MFIYTNTRRQFVRLFTSKGVVTLDGLASLELDEKVSCPEWVKVTPQKKKKTLTPVDTEATQPEEDAKPEEVFKKPKKAKKTKKEV